MNFRLMYLVIVCLNLIIINVLAVGIRINEVMPDNATSLYNDSFNNPDWIELYNNTDKPVNLKSFRISDKYDFSRAWIIPDTIIYPKSYLVIYASDEDTVISDKWTIESSGSGIFQHSIFDSYRYDYIDVSGDFEISVEASSVPPIDVGAPHGGLVVKEKLDKTSQFVGLLYLNMGSKLWYWYTYRVNGITLPKYEFPDFENHNKTSWLRMQRMGDTVYTFCEDGQGYILDSHTNYFPQKDVYVGIATASTDENRLSLFHFKNLEINNQSFDINNLNEADINTKIKGRRYKSREMHANFKLSDEGETVYLWDSTGILIDRMDFGKMRNDISFARVPDGSINCSYIFKGTPNKSNTKSIVYCGIQDTPEFSINGGWFDNKIKVTIKANKADSIFYTTDGSAPCDTTLIYNGEEIDISKNTVIRAKAIRKNYLPSNILTRTFFIGDSSDLPVISISTEPNILHNDDSTGMFDKIFSNVFSTSNIEYFERNKILSFEALTEMKIIGHGVARGHSQSSLRFDGRSYLGNNNLTYKFFGDNSLNDYETIVLRNSSADWNTSFLRDAFIGLLSRKIPSQITSAYQPVLSFLNGQFFGLYNLKEHINESYISEKYNIPEDSVNFMRNFNEPTAGSVNGFFKFLDTLFQSDVNSKAGMELINRNLDLENLFDYIILSLYVSNFDWPVNNIKQWHSNSFDGKWRFIGNDFDWTFGFDSYVTHPSNDCVEWFFTRKELPGYLLSKILTRILENYSYTNEFLNKTADLLNSVFLPAPVISLIDSMHNNIESVVERQRNLHPDCMELREMSHKSMINFACKRPDFLRSDMVEQFNLSGTARLKIRSNLDKNYIIKVNSLSVQNKEFDGIYFKGVPVEIEIVSGNDSSFFGWSNPLLPVQTKITVMPEDSIELIAYYKTDENLLPLVINEIMYKPKDDNDCRDWFEIYNPNDVPVLTGNYYFRDSDENHRFNFPVNSRIEAKGFMIVAEDPDKFKTYYPDKMNIIGPFDFGLGKTDLILISDEAGNFIDSVSYSNQNPWPDNADGNGQSIELLDPEFDNTLGKNWRTAEKPLGSPNEYNTDYTSFLTGYNNKDNEIRLFPNPASDFIEINVTAKDDSHGEIGIYDVFGQDLTQLPLSIVERGVRIDVSSLLEGVYFVKINEKVLKLQIIR